MTYPIILNGDHAEFEREHADTPPEQRPDWPLPSFDAQDWAKFFLKINPNCGLDEGYMITWFANALMRGFDEASARHANAEAANAALRAEMAQIAKDVLDYGQHTIDCEVRCPSDRHMACDCELSDAMKRARAALARETKPA